MSQFNMRCLDGELAKWKARAQQKSLNVSSWLRGLANAEVGLGYRGAVVHQGPSTPMTTEQMVQEDDEPVKDSVVEYDKRIAAAQRKRWAKLKKGKA